MIFTTINDKFSLRVDCRNPTQFASPRISLFKTISTVCLLFFCFWYSSCCPYLSSSVIILQNKSQGTLFSLMFVRNTTILTGTVLHHLLQPKKKKIYSCSMFSILKNTYFNYVISLFDCYHHGWMRCQKYVSLSLRIVLFALSQSWARFFLLLIRFIHSFYFQK